MFYIHGLCITRGAPFRFFFLIYRDQRQRKPIGARFVAPEAQGLTGVPAGRAVGHRHVDPVHGEVLPALRGRTRGGVVASTSGGAKASLFGFTLWEYGGCPLRNDCHWRERDTKWKTTIVRLPPINASTCGASKTYQHPQAIGIMINIFWVHLLGA